MNAIVQILNTGGRAFVDLAVPMLIQSSVLILILLAVDTVLRKRVRAVVRYWIWMLVLVKLMLPPSLWSPVSVGTWLGDKLEVPATALLEAPAPPAEPRPAEPSSFVADLLSQPRRTFVEPPGPRPTITSPAPAPTEFAPPIPTAPTPRPPALSLTWQGLVLLVWAAMVTTLLLLLAQRTFFVRGLVAQGQEAGQALRGELDQCRRRLGLSQPVSLRLSPNAASPAVCGLWRPVILIPQNVASRLYGADLQAVLFHELAHVTRGDLWVNLLQTLLQIVYFYHPLLWLANGIIRRIREKAVDETVLVALGEAAPQYPETLVHVAKLALARRPTLSLRLLGVVESKSALTSRIRHILNRPLPQTAKLGLLGLLAIFLIAAVLLPMAKGSVLGGRFGKDVFFRFSSNPTDATQRRVGDKEFYTEYTVSFRKGEKLAVVAELYQDGQPMRTLGTKVFSDPGQPQKLSARLTREYRNRDKTSIGLAVEVALGAEVFRVKNVQVNTPRWYNATESSFFYESQIARTRDGRGSSVRFANLLWIKAGPVENNSTGPHVWIPAGDDIATMYGDAYLVLLKMFPVSQLRELRILGPAGRAQLPDGRSLEADASGAERQAVADEYALNLKRLLLRERMPLNKVLAHAYQKKGESIWIYFQAQAGVQWKPKLEEIYHGPDFNPCFFSIDGKEYPCGRGFGPFDAGGGAVDLSDTLYGGPAGFQLPVGKHTAAYGWKDVDVVDPNEPDQPVHFPRLLTDPVEFEVVEQIPPDYYRQVYEEGWEDILRRSLQPTFTDDWHKGMPGALLGLKVDGLPFDTAFAVYIQAEGSEQQYRGGEMALTAGMHHFSMGCDFGVKALNWDTVGDKRWRIMLKPSVEMAKKYPPIRVFYGREFATDWLTFERSPQFAQNRLSEEGRKGGPPHYGGTIKADTPVDLDLLGRRWKGQGEAWPLPASFELGWSPDQGGTLRIDPNSGVRLLWLPEAEARLVRVTEKTRQRLVELPQSRTTQIVPPQGEPTLTAVLSSEGKIYFVTVSKVNETWANLSWYEDEEATRKLASAEPVAVPTGPPTRPPETATQTTPTQREFSFGPHQYLDLDTDQFVAVPPAQAANVKSLRARGVDLYLTVESGAPNGHPLIQVKALQMAYAVAPAGVDLQEISTDDVRTLLRMAAQPLAGAKRVAAYMAGGTYAFRTAEGTAGVFRLTWPRTDDPPCCRLVYRHIPELDLPDAGALRGTGRGAPAEPGEAANVSAAGDSAITKPDKKEPSSQGAGGGALAGPEKANPAQDGDRLKQMLAAARPGSIIAVPTGRYTVPLEITQPLTLRGTGAEDCIIEVTANQPAILVNTRGRGQVTLENLTIRWQLATDQKVELPAAVLVKDADVVLRQCRLAALGDARRSPNAVYFEGKSKGTVDNCRFRGFDYVICYGSGTEGVVQDSFIAACGHQGVIAYDGATLIVQRNIITGSKFHAVRSTGGTLTVQDNLLIQNANRGIYLGNRTGRGTITNNLILGNGTGISAFGRADYVIANNAIVSNGYAGIDMRDSCRLSIRGNALAQNQRGLALIKEGTENSNVVGPNVFWANATDTENLEKGAGSITADPQFVDPNHGDFTMRAPARDQGYGLTNPQILKDLWQRYQQLQSTESKVSQSQTPVPAQDAAPVAGNTAPAALAWQRADRYVPPDPNRFFPDDPEAGKKLDALFQAADKDQRSEEEILSAVRQGLRTSAHRQGILQWLGERYIWNKDPQNPQAIEIMYHAAPLEPYWALYTGLAVVRDKPANVLRTLAELCMQGEDVRRIAWGIGAQREQLLSYIQAYLRDPDPAQQEMAAALLKHFNGELPNLQAWLHGYRIRQGQIKFGSQLAQLQQTLLTGDSETRYRTMTTTLYNRRWFEMLDDSFLPVMQTLSTDPDGRVRDEVAHLAGTRWIWGAPRQDPNAIDLVLKLSADSDRNVRNHAVYYGLSVVRDKSEPVVRRLVQLALADQESNFYGRIVWGLKNSAAAGRALLERTLAEQWQVGTTEDRHAAIRRLYQDVLGQDPPATWPGDQKPADPPADAASRGVSGRVVDPNGRPVAGAQVARCTKDKGVDISGGQLSPTRFGGKGGEIVQTDAEGRFSFAPGPDEFDLIAAQEKGFAWVTHKQWSPSGDLRLEPWGRVEGTLRIGRQVGAGERIGLLQGGNRSAADQNIHLDYETYADTAGRFTFEKVPPIWMEVGYLIRIGDSTSTDTNRTTIHVPPGQTLKMTLGGAGRPVIGKFVPPPGYQGPIYFGEGLRALDTPRPDWPRPANYDRMTKREQQQWLREWSKTPQADAYYDALWHDLKRRQYSFRIQDDGAFRVEDVVPGRYQFTVWLEERSTGEGRPEEIGAYYGSMEVPPIPGGRTDEPLDLGNLTLAMHKPPLHAGDMAPLFEARTLEGKDIRLADYRGKFVVLSFWQPQSHPELERLKELYQIYGGTGRFAIIGLGGNDTLEEVTKYVAEHQIEWPEVYFDAQWDKGVAGQYGLRGLPYLLLVNPDGKIVATWLRGEKLAEAVRQALP